MFFAKGERKKRHFGLKLAVAALAVAGAVGMVNCGKRWIKAKGNQIVSFFKSKPKKDECGDCMLEE